MHRILHLRLRERGLVVNAPVHRLQTLIDKALLEEVKERLGDRRLIRQRHGQVGIAPSAKHPEPLKLAALQVHILLRVLAACPANRQRLHLELLPSQLLIHLDLDRQTVAVPSRHIRRIEAGHGLRLHHKVLDALVQRMPQVDRAVGVRRAVMEDVPWPPRASLTNLVVQPLLLPCLQTRRLVQRQVRLHGKAGLG